MNERAVYFGPRNGLLGVLSLPSQPRDDVPAVILLNAGLLHRVGPNRLYVDIARRLAEEGYRCLRFDMSGVGDSELLDGNLLDIERSRRDVVEAMNALHDMTGTEHFFLMGLCTGAFNAFRTALIDERVKGCVLLDGYSYPTIRSRFRHYRTRVFELHRWTGYLKRRLGRGSGEPGQNPNDLILFENEVVPKKRFRSELATLIDRGTAMMLIYTGLGPLAFNYERQMHDAFPHLDLDRSATVRYYPDADHTFRLPGNRNRLLDDIRAWMLTQHPVPAPLPSSTT